MNVIGFSGYSGSGKTTLIERLIPLLKARGLRVSVVKHAHHKFDIDYPGKDTFRHREAGAFEVVVASNKRLALMREFPAPSELSVHHLIAELWEGVDWVLVEGFKHSDLLKIEVWRAQPDSPGDSQGGTQHESSPRYPDDDFIAAIATDVTSALPVATSRPVFDINQPQTIADYLLASGERFAYLAERYTP